MLFLKSKAGKKKKKNINIHGKACLKSGKLFEMEASEELEMEKHLEFGNMIGYLSHNTQDDVT